MYRISIIDGFCPRAYDDRSLTTESMGGTESAVVLLAEAIASVSNVEVVQHCRKDSYTSSRDVRYRGRIGNTWRSDAASVERDVAIIINSPKLMAMWRRQDPSCQIFLWRHNFLSNRHRLLMDALVEYNATMICVSRFHQIDSRRAQRHYSSTKRTVVIPNPVQVYRHGQVKRNPNHLLFCSSPHKGLDDVIERFVEVRQAIPSLQLRICNPGYLSNSEVRESGIAVLGTLSRPQLHAEMTAALCVFYPQTRFRETFGLIGAEANALGTPVLAPAGLGALSEVLNGEGQLLHSVDTPGIVRQLKTWRSGQIPLVSGRAEFDPIAVAKRWMAMISRRSTDESVLDGSVEKRQNALAEMEKS